MATYSIKIGRNDPIFVETDDTMPQFVDHVLSELYGGREEKDYASSTGEG